MAAASFGVSGAVRHRPGRPLTVRFGAPYVVSMEPQPCKKFGVHWTSQEAAVHIDRTGLILPWNRVPGARPRGASDYIWFDPAGSFGELEDVLSRGGKQYRGLGQGREVGFICDTEGLYYELVDTQDGHGVNVGDASEFPEHGIRIRPRVPGGDFRGLNWYPLYKKDTMSPGNFVRRLKQQIATGEHNPLESHIGVEPPPTR